MHKREFDKLAGAFPHLVIDARPLNGTNNGIGRYVDQFVRQLPEVTDATITLISNRTITTSTPLPKRINQLIDNKYWVNVPGTIWFHLRAEKIAAELKCTHFLGTQHVLPPVSDSGIHKAVIIHDLVFQKFPETMQIGNRLVSSFLVPRSILNADSIFCVSDTTRTDLLSNFPVESAKVSVAYPGCSFGAEKNSMSNTNRGPLRFLVVGSLEPRKNLGVFLRAFMQMRLNGHDFKLDLVSGSAWGKTLTTELVESIELDSNISIYKNISDVELQSLYRSADFLVFPSIYEGFGLPLLEAIDKCAIIVNEIPVFREIGAHIDNVIYVDFNKSEDEISSSFALLNRSPPARFRTRSDVELFTWNKCASSIVKGIGIG
ncbi:glycosyltransferase family 4 protein [Undibacterium sp. RuRC25W]|uniref:glycosyltransferase family 4 protein n=1 Tax=Undibacterium sp. RuRC25W TaxID=3413047 RepID=UPI003BEF6171